MKLYHILINNIMPILLTIVFFWALFLSIFSLIAIVRWETDNTDDARPSFILTIISCVLWSLLFYLLH